MRTFLVALLLVSGALAGCATSSAPTASEGPYGSAPLVGQPTSLADRRHAASFNGSAGPYSKLQFVAQLQADGAPFPTGSGNFVLGDFVYGSALGNGFFIADVKDPAHPVLAYRADTKNGETSYGRKAEVVSHPDGRLTLVIANGGKTIQTWNVTDPYHPTFGATVDVTRNHYVAQVPGTEVAVSSPSSGAGGTNAFVNVHDPTAPVIVGTFGGYGCHGVTFHGRLGDAKFRGYCAGVDATEIWDMTGFDAGKPNLGITVLATVAQTDNPLIGAGGLHHLATTNDDASILIIGDEFAGGGQPGACFASVDAMGRTVSTPLGALWFYDVSNERSPVLKGWITPPTMTPLSPPVAPPVDPTGAFGTDGAGCTAHFGQVIPGTQQIVIAWYNAGVLLIDFSDPANPVILDQYQGDGRDTWSARVENGYVFTGDIGRGMDVLKLA